MAKRRKYARRSLGASNAHFFYRACVINFWHLAAPEFEDDFMTFEEMESAFVGALEPHHLPMLARAFAEQGH